ncbi:MAG: DUF6273 domain-containing protein [bacterium]|nr:DUF6273 domain-containing protein [bacterium]
MKRINKKGFTLVELLAVIVIMGILMMVAIPSISRVIENSRKDTFVDIAKSYANAAKTLWTADTLTCEGTVASAVDDGDYYILINTKESARAILPVLVDQGGKSSWGNRDVNGYVRVHVETVTDNNGEPKRTTTFYVSLSDGTHGLIDNGSMTSDNLKKGNVKMDLLIDDKKKIELTLDNGNLNCSKTNFGTYMCTDVAPVKNITGLCVDDSSYAGNNGTVDINPVSFADDDWATIAAVAKSGKYAEYYNVGDTKEVDLGSLGKHTVRIANTSTPAECSQEGFSQTACGFVLEFTDVITSHVMNSTGTNVGGWPASSMRSYLSTDIYNALPTDLQNAIMDTKVVSGHGSSDSTNFTSTDKLYLLEPKEVYGYNGGTAHRATRQLDYYLAQGVPTSNRSGAIKQRNGSNYWWWLRAANSNYGNSFYNVKSTGDWEYLSDYHNTAMGVSPAFRIA